MPNMAFLFIIGLLFWSSGCGFLDEDILMTDEEYMFMEGLSISGTGSSGGCGGGSYSHTSNFHFIHSSVRVRGGREPAASQQDSKSIESDEIDGRELENTQVESDHRQMATALGYAAEHIEERRRESVNAFLHTDED